MSEVQEPGTRRKLKPNRFRITSIIIATVMLVGAFGVFIGPVTVNVSAAPDTHIWDGGATPDRLASSGTNWVSDVAPEAGDSVVFNAGALPCTWSLAITLNTFTTTSDYSGAITLLANTNWGTTGDITLEGIGGFYGVATSTITDAGNFVDSTVIVDSCLNLRMTGTGKTFSGTGDLGWYKSLRFSGDTTLLKSIATTWDPSTLIIDAGVTVTLTGATVKLEILDGTVLTNSGMITGTGYVLIGLDGTDRTMTTASTGTINCPVKFQARVGATDNRIAALAGDLSFGSTVTVNSLHVSRTMTLDLSSNNYNLTAIDSITIGTRGIINGRSGTITCWSLVGYLGILSGTPTLNILGELTQRAPLSLVAEPENPNRKPTWVWDQGMIAEQNDFKIGNSFISWYRGGNGNAATGIGYQTSTDGITWIPNASNPIITGYLYPTVIYVNSCYYMFAHNISDGNLYLFNLTANHINPDIMNGGNPVYTHSVTTSDWDYEIYNVGVTVVNGTWHMMMEGKAQGQSFALGYAYSTLVDLNWTGNRSANYVIPFAGNPTLTYIPERYSILMLYGNNIDAYWQTKAGYVNPDVDMSILGNWHLISNTTFSLNQSGIHVCDAEILTPFNSQYGFSISYGWDQTSISQAYYPGTLLQFFCQIAYNSYPLTPYLRTGYNIVSAFNNKSINWNVGSVLSTISMETDHDLYINLTIWNPSGLQIATWTANSSDPSAIVTFTLSGLESGRMYRLYIDGVSSSLLTASESGAVSFTYSGPWSEHQFEIVATSIGGSISGLVNLVFIMFAIGIVVGVVAEGTNSLRKMQMRTTEQMVKSLLNMVIYIVIGIASLGVLYSMVI